MSLIWFLMFAWSICKLIVAIPTTTPTTYDEQIPVNNDEDIDASRAKRGGSKFLGYTHIYIDNPDRLFNSNPAGNGKDYDDFSSDAVTESYVHITNLPGHICKDGINCTPFDYNMEQQGRANEVYVILNNGPENKVNNQMYPTENVQAFDATATDNCNEQATQQSSLLFNDGNNIVEHNFYKAPEALTAFDQDMEENGSTTEKLKSLGKPTNRGRRRKPKTRMRLPNRPQTVNDNADNREIQQKSPKISHVSVSSNTTKSNAKAKIGVPIKFTTITTTPRTTTTTTTTTVPTTIDTTTTTVTVPTTTPTTSDSIRITARTWATVNITKNSSSSTERKNSASSVARNSNQTNTMNENEYKSNEEITTEKPRNKPEIKTKSNQAKAKNITETVEDENSEESDDVEEDIKNRNNLTPSIEDIIKLCSDTSSTSDDLENTPTNCIEHYIKPKYNKKSNKKPHRRPKPVYYEPITYEVVLPKFKFKQNYPTVECNDDSASNDYNSDAGKPSYNYYNIKGLNKPKRKRPSNNIAWQGFSKEKTKKNKNKKRPNNNYNNNVLPGMSYHRRNQQQYNQQPAPQQRQFQTRHRTQQFRLPQRQKQEQRQQYQTQQYPLHQNRQQEQQLQNLQQRHHFHQSDNAYNDNNSYDTDCDNTDNSNYSNISDNSEYYNNSNSENDNNSCSSEEEEQSRNSQANRNYDEYQSDGDNENSIEPLGNDDCSESEDYDENFT